MSAFRRRWLPRLALVVGGTVAAFALAEGYVRVQGLGWRTVNRSLYWQGSDLEVYRYSDDPFLHYELKPGARTEGQGPWANRFVISVDEHGARGPAHGAAAGSTSARAPGSRSSAAISARVSRCLRVSLFFLVELSRRSMRLAVL